MSAGTAPVVVIGELLVDIVHTPDGQTAEHVGGSPANVALGLARLGHDTWFATLVGTDARGIRCTEHVEDGGVQLLPGSTDPDTPDVHGRRHPRRVRRRDLRLRPALEPAARCSCPRAPPTCTSARSAPRSLRATPRSPPRSTAPASTGTVSYDPNMRPTIMGSADAVRPRVERARGTVRRRQVLRGRHRVALPGRVARAGDGQVGGARRRRSPSSRSAPAASPGVRRRVTRTANRRRPSTVVDTVGAGDSFMAGPGVRSARRRPARQRSRPATGCGRRSRGGAPCHRPRPGDERRHGAPRRCLRPHPRGDPMTDFSYEDLLPVGADETALPAADHRGRVGRRRPGRAPLPAGRARGAAPAHRDRDARHRALPAPGPPAAARQHPRRPGGEQQRQVRRARPAQEREHRRGRHPADVPGHRHRDRHGQARPARAHPGPRRGADQPRRLRRLHAAQPALLADGARSRRGRSGTPAPTCPPRSSSTPTPPPGHETTYKFLFMAKGGGSANKSYLFQETKAILNPDAMLRFLDEKLRGLGTAACPPYHLAIVIGGTSAEFALKTAKYASAKYLDQLPKAGDPATGHGFRDTELEEKVLELTRQFGIGAQFGGKYFCHDVRVVRLPRHGASLPVAIAVSCSADRQVLGKITPEGVFIEQLETDPARFLPDQTHTGLGDEQADAVGASSTGQGAVVSIDLNRPMARSSRSSPSTRSRPGCRSPDRSSSPATSRTRRSRSGSTPARRCRTTCATTRSTTPARPRPRRGCRPARSARPPPAGWTPTSTSSRPPAARWSCWPRATAASRSPTPARRTAGSTSARSAGRPRGWHRTASSSVEVLEYPELGMEAIWKIEVEDFPGLRRRRRQGQRLLRLGHQAGRLHDREAHRTDLSLTATRW